MILKSFIVGFITNLNEKLGSLGELIKITMVRPEVLVTERVKLEVLFGSISPQLREDFLLHILG